MAMCTFDGISEKVLRRSRIAEMIREFREDCVKKNIKLRASLKGLRSEYED